MDTKLNIYIIILVIKNTLIHKYIYNYFNTCIYLFKYKYFGTYFE